MEKKLKVNFILKGIAIFAFVAFCLLAILAGVTLPFVSNASTADSAIASADNTLNYDNFTTTLSNCNTTDTYYGFYITEEFYNFVKTYNFEVGVPIFFGSVSFINSNSSFLFYCSGVYDSSNTLKFNVFSYTYDFDNNIYIFQSDVPYSSINRAVLFNQGFKFQNIYSDNQSDEEHIPVGFKDKIKVFTSLPSGGDTTELENQIATLTAEKNALQAQLTEKQNQIDTLTAEKATLQSQVNSLTSDKATLQAQLTEKQNQIDTLTAEKNALQTQVNNLTSDMAALQSQLTEKQNQIYTLTSEKNALQSQLDSISFSSHFGFVSNFSSSFLYANLNVFPVIPDNLTTIKDTSGNYINGWYQSGDSLYLSIVTAYISPNEIRRPSICGWSLVPRSDDSNYDLYFSFLGSTIYYCGIAQIIDNTVNVIDTSSKRVLVQSNFDGNVYMVSSSLYYFKLNSSFTRDDVNSFFALVDLDNFSPSDNQYYFAGFNAASKGYFDDGYNQGYSVGKEEGYNTGFTAGDSNGFARGLESANNYSFLSLFGAIFDAPIKALFGGTSTLPAGTTITDSNGNTITLQSTTTVNRAGLLNFEVMGVNLSGFVLALFSISIIVVVIKFALAKK